MKKGTILVLMLCLILLGALCYAHGEARTENEKGKDGIPIELIERASHSSSEKDSAIQASINCHTLTVVFTENLGQVTIEVTTAMGTSVHYTQTPTPNGFQIYILNTGNYIITFTLPNGDEYYGEFTVTD